MSVTTEAKTRPATKRANKTASRDRQWRGDCAAAEAAASATVGGGIGCGGVLRRAARCVGLHIGNHGSGGGGGAHHHPAGGSDQP